MPNDLRRPAQPYGIYHWDTFDPPGKDTMYVDEANTLCEALIKCAARYGDRITAKGADYIEIVYYENGQGIPVVRLPLG